MALDVFRKMKNFVEDAICTTQISATGSWYLWTSATSALLAPTEVLMHYDVCIKVHNWIYILILGKTLLDHLFSNDTDEYWDQTQQETKKSTYLWKLIVISLEKARWKYLKQCPKLIVTLQDNKEHTSNEANIIGTIMQWSNIRVVEALHNIIY